MATVDQGVDIVNEQGRVDEHKQNEGAPVVEKITSVETICEDEKAEKTSEEESSLEDEKAIQEEDEEEVEGDVEISEGADENAASKFETNVILQHMSGMKSTRFGSQVISLLSDHNLNNNKNDSYVAVGEATPEQQAQRHLLHLRTYLSKIGLALVLIAFSPLIGLSFFLYASWFVANHGTEKLVMDSKQAIHVYCGEIDSFSSYFHTDSLQEKVMQARKVIQERLQSPIVERLPHGCKTILNSLALIVSYPVALVLAFKDGTAAFPRKRKHEEGLSLFIIDDSSDARKRRRKVSKPVNVHLDADRIVGNGENMQDVVETLQVIDAVVKEYQSEDPLDKSVETEPNEDPMDKSVETEPNDTMLGSESELKNCSVAQPNTELETTVVDETDTQGSDVPVTLD